MTIIFMKELFEELADRKRPHLRIAVDVYRMFDMLWEDIALEKGVTFSIRRDGGFEIITVD